ncbi:hypothetical protein ElyMa_000982400 [Elysia marginata]|uniref:Uncharacterized protein n=1 Tax=Elysia marginata TaxID=1093978 RepID=A0AAV4HGN2_9GAST|nr:hypothetical protein ElyMa_000982400 [Elysia marginata]
MSPMLRFSEMFLRGVYRYKHYRSSYSTYILHTPTDQRHGTAPREADSLKAWKAFATARLSSSQRASQRASEPASPPAPTPVPDQQV